jgi:hypothetical protein
METSFMPGKTLLELRDLAREMADARGHKIKRWNRGRALRFTDVCAACRANLVICSRMAKKGIWPDFTCGRGMIVARDRDCYWTGLDYNWAEGKAPRCGVLVDQ